MTTRGPACSLRSIWPFSGPLYTCEPEDREHLGQGSSQPAKSSEAILSIARRACVAGTSADQNWSFFLKIEPTLVLHSGARSLGEVAGDDEYVSLANAACQRLGLFGCDHEVGLVFTVSGNSLQLGKHFRLDSDLRGLVAHVQLGHR